MTIDQQRAERLASSMDGARGVAARITGTQEAPATPAGTFDTFRSQLIQGASDIHDLSGSLDYFAGQLETIRTNARRLAREDEG